MAWLWAHIVALIKTLFTNVFEVSIANKFYVDLPVSGRVFTAAKIFSIAGLAGKEAHRTAILDSICSTIEFQIMWHHFAAV